MYLETPESPRIFKSDFLDFFTRVNVLSVPVLFVPIVTFCVGWSVLHSQVSIPLTAGLFVVGFIAWTLSEYWLHRTLFHWQPNARWGRTMHFFIHGVHHQWPNDPYRLVMPPWVNLSLLFLVVGPAALLLAGHWGWAFLAGYVAGYMNYDVTHYYIHHGRPKLAWYKKLRAHHMNHHHNKVERKFGVSFAFWDRVFNTL
jgi:sterol desaturase/sphingolipid hydroxylase (fatty acid hydroxylase superfamily)